MKCKNCGHINDKDAGFCEKCGANLNESGSMLSLNKALILVVVVLVCLIGVFAASTYFSGQNQTQNQTPKINQTVENGTNITWTPEYISFDDAKAIAKQNAESGVSVSDPILMKDRNGLAVYVSYYYYNGYMIGGIIINAKTGDILYKEQNLPGKSNKQTYNNNYYQDTNSDDGYYYDDDDDYYDDTQDDQETCPECDGSGVVLEDPNDPHSYWVECPTCGGTGTVSGGS